MFKQNAVIVFQGDSITDCGRPRDAAHCNVGMGSGYPLLSAAAMLAGRPELGLQIYNRGIGGNRIVDLYARWKIDTLNLKPDVISILIGVNDTWHEKAKHNGVEPERYEVIYRMLLEWTLKTRPNVKLVLCEPFVLVCGSVTPDWVPEIDARRAVVRKLAEEFGTVFVPFQKVFSDALQKAPAEYWLADGVHPHCAGHALMAKAWLEAVQFS